jgi:hypothetical protein
MSDARGSISSRLIEILRLSPTCLACFLVCSFGDARADEGRIKFDSKQTFEISLDGPEARAVASRLEAKDVARPLNVYVLTSQGEPAKTPLDGSLTLEGTSLRFQARFPLEPGLSYRAVYQPMRPAAAKTLTQTFRVPKGASAPATKITAVYPTQNVLPENQLKFYLHFSAPMSRGEVYRRVHLLNEKGHAIDLPFLELEQELWDQRQQRITLLFDPGRIKRGLKPREEAGPVLEEGKKYTFVIDADWPDAGGNPLASGFRKSFRAGPPDDQIVDLAKWKINAPPAGSKKSVIIDFPKAMDQALAERLIWIETMDGKRVDGTSSLVEQEHRWEFRPQANWSAGNYRVAIDSTIEDLAGNSIAKPFEIDVLRPVEKKIPINIHYLPFAAR